MVMRNGNDKVTLQDGMATFYPDLTSFSSAPLTSINLTRLTLPAPGPEGALAPHTQHQIKVTTTTLTIDGGSPVSSSGTIGLVDQTGDNPLTKFKVIGRWVKWSVEVL